MPSVVGDRGEQAAWEAYRRRGYVLLARNWTCSLGELDLIVLRDGVVVFCEVKARRSARLGGPHEAVTPAKQRKIRSVAEVFATRHPEAIRGYRFDVASVWVGRHGADVHLFEDAF